MVRGRLNRHAEWDHAAWGLPIPQPYMAFTLAEFGSIALPRDAPARRPLHRLRARRHLPPVALRRPACRHRPRTSPRSPRPTITASRTSTPSRAPARTKPTSEFVAALTEFQATELAKFMPPGPVRKLAPKLMAGYQRAFIGDAAAEALAIPDTRLKHLPTSDRPDPSGGLPGTRPARARRQVTPDGARHPLPRRRPPPHQGGLRREAPAGGRRSDVRQMSCWPPSMS